MLLHLEDEELSSPLSDTLVPTVSHTWCEKLDMITINFTSDDEHDPLTLWHVEQSRYWNKWLTTMHEELEALKAKGVYEEVEHLSHGRKAVQCKWVLHIKRDKDGQISCFKGHLVAKGFTQILGQDFSFTFTPVTCWDSIHSTLCITALNDLELHHIDVKNAYLNAPLEEEIYMVAPEGCGT
jgi:hypothetical protein